MKCGLGVGVGIGTGAGGQGAVAEVGPDGGGIQDLGLGLGLGPEEDALLIGHGHDLLTNLHLDVIKMIHLQTAATLLGVTLLITNNDKFRRSL